MRALFYEFPDEPELFAVDRQYLVGRDILVTPVLTPNVSTVDGEYFIVDIKSEVLSPVVRNIPWPWKSNLA
jgi:hypothetical protein